MSAPLPSPRRPAAVALLFPLLLAGAAPIPAQDVSRAVEDEVRFAERLAQFRYFDLAIDVLAETRKGRLDNRSEGAALLTEALILRRQSESTGDPARELELKGQAIAKLEDWAAAGSAWAFHPRRADALDHLATLLSERGRLRLLRPADGAADEAATKRARELALADFRQSDQVLEQLGKDYEDRGKQHAAADERDKASELADLAGMVLYRRGLNRIDWALVEPDRSFGLEEAFRLLDDFQWSLDEERLVQYFALHYQGVVQRLLGEVEEAIDYQRDVLDRARWYWDNERVDPDSGQRNERIAPFIAELMDRAWGELAQAQLDADDAAGAESTIQEMLTRHASDKEEFGRPGLNVLLSWAETLSGLGQQGRAAEIVKLVADQGRNLPEGEIARRRLGEIVAEGGGGDSAAVLVAAARGLSDQGRWNDASFTWLRAAAAAEADPADRRTFALDAWLGAGQSLLAERRFLEAAQAFSRALETATKLEAIEDLRRQAAQSVYASRDRRFKETGDAFDRRLRDTASERLIALGGGEDLLFLNAKMVFDEAAAARPPDPARYEAALDEFRAVPASAPNHERALVHVARSLAGLGRRDEALAAFDVMLARARDPAAAPLAGVSAQRREVALGEALYYKALLLLEGGDPQPDAALELLAGFEQKLPGQASLVESVKYQRVVAHALRGELADMQAAYEDLRAFREDGTFVAIAAFRVAESLVAVSNRAREGGDGPAADEALSSAADFMWLYNEKAGFPSLTNLQNCGQWFLAVGRPAEAQRAFAKLLEVFAGRAGITDAQLDPSRIGLAQALNAQHDFQRARPLWKELLARRDRDPVVQRGAALCFGGWLDAQPDGSFVELSGSGDFADAVSLWDQIHRSLGSRKYERAWWESRVYAIYGRYRDGAAKPARLVDARTLLNNARAITPEFDQDTVEGLEPNLRYTDLLRPALRYLDRKVP